MSNVYVLDACSLIAALFNEDGADVVRGLMQKSVKGEIKIKMHRVNLLEVYYYVYKKKGEKSALNFLNEVKVSPIKFNTEISDDILIKAGRYKSLYKMSLADSIGLAEALINEGSFVTADHHELDIVKEKEKLNITWIR